MDELLAWLKQRLQKRQNVFCELPSTITKVKNVLKKEGKADKVMHPSCLVTSPARTPKGLLPFRS